ncbi:hypothetical protein NESM_000171500 [Novymonas esmeraldas]|uniref:Uncharacterized protein n=1 Tax=Novymonas esmeraldas TaxID=1808958 RepID=A0AAW0F618_9TRYP
MNEDSGGWAAGRSREAVPSAALELTPEAEAALLAEYGVAGPYDDVLDWAAPSKFRSELGDGHVFLTGAADADAGDDGDTAGASGGDNGGRPNSFKDPLHLYLLTQFPSLILPSRSLPSALVQRIADSVDALEEPTGVARTRSPQHAQEVAGHLSPPSAASPHAAVLRGAKEWDRRARLAVQGVSAAAAASQLLASGGPDSGTAASPAAPDEAVAEMEHRRLLDATRQLLAKADAALAVGAVPADEEAAGCVEALQRREALLSEDVLDQHYDKEDILHDEEEEEQEVAELLRRAQEGRRRLLAAVKSAAAEAPTGDASSAAEAAAPAQVCDDGVVGDAERARTAAPTRLPYLYAFEMRMPSRQAVDASPLLPMRVVDAALRVTEESAPHAVAGEVEALEDVVDPVVLRCTAEALTSIAEMEVRDVQAQISAAASREAYVRARRPRSAVTNARVTMTQLRHNDRNALGLVALPPFAHQLDVLLSPTRAEQPQRRTTVEDRGRDGGEEGRRGRSSDSSDAAARSRPTAVESLQQIRRRAALESLLLDRETAEYRRMRLEEEMCERETRAAAQLLSWHTEQRVELVRAAVEAGGRLGELQRIAFAELTAAAAKDKALARQAQNLRSLQEAERLVYTLVMEWEVQREQILVEEAWARGRLRSDASEAAQHASAATERRVQAERAAAWATQQQLRAAMELERARCHAGATCDDTAHDEARSGGRQTAREVVMASAWYRWHIAPLLEERAAVLRWGAAQRRTLQQLHTRVAEAKADYCTRTAAATLLRHDTNGGRGGGGSGGGGEAVALPESPPLPEHRTSAEGSDSASERGVLGATALVRLLWPALHAAVTDPDRAVHHLTALPLSLEELRRVSWEELRHLRLRVPQAATAPRGGGRGAVVAVAPLVKELDLSGNPLLRLDVAEAVRTFTSLHSLRLSHTQLRSLAAAAATAADTSSASDGDRAGGGVGGGGAPHQRRISSSLSSTPGSASSRSARLRHVSAARDHALAAQVRLLSIDVSSNELASLAPLGTLASTSLVRCVATENRLTTLDSLGGCAQLREMAAAHNQLRCLRGTRTMPLLRELDVGNNALASLTTSGGAGDGDDGDGTPGWVLLSRLYASHNPLRSLPASLHVYPCLTQLFVNQTQLTALDAAALAWFPMLSVLQAEGNAIADISGVRHCLRLQTLRLSWNQLPSVRALEPLRCCARLRVLDLTGNPCLTADPSVAPRACSVKHALLNLVPSLVELNNAPLPPHTVGSVVRGSHGEADDDGGAPPLSLPVGCAVTAELYRDVFAAVCWDAQVRYLAEEAEQREVYATRPISRARGWEATAADIASGGPMPRPGGDDGPHSSPAMATTGAVHGMTAAQHHVRTAVHQHAVELYCVDAALLSGWLQLTHPLPTTATTSAAAAACDALANRHASHCRYDREVQDRLEGLARAYLAEWLHGRLCIRRARRELRRRREAYQRSEAHRREMAARRIQPVWRGAALRSRLRRFLHPTKVGTAFAVGRGDDDELEGFAKVDVEDWGLEDAVALMPVAVLLHEVVESGRGVAAVPFNVPPPGAAAALASTAAALTPAPPRDGPSRIGLVSGRPAPRGAGGGGAGDAPPSDGGVGGGAEGGGGGRGLDEEWGPLVAAQIRKKQQKSTRTHQQQRRQEFLLDPLRVKREMRQDRMHPAPKQ